ncbi:MAG: Phenylacetic acid catabolic protein [Gemmatimonadales bacterium]
MSPTCAAGLRNLLLGLADTKLLLGYHYGEWTFGPPALEAAIASCSLSQTELGHVRLIHAILRNHYGDEPDGLVEDRGSLQFANVSYLDRPIPDWPGFVAANYVVDLAMTRLLHAMRDSTFKPLGMSVGKMLDEERYHIHHGQGWLRTLAKKGDAELEAVRDSVTRALAAVIAWFGPENEEEDGALVSAGIKSRSNPAVRDDFLADVEKTTVSLDMDVPVERPESFGGWSPATRRLGSGGPDEEILQHLAGRKNAIFKLK